MAGPHDNDEVVDVEQTGRFLSKLDVEILRTHSKDTSFIARAIVIALVAAPFFYTVVVAFMSEQKAAAMNEVYKAWFSVIGPVIGAIVGAVVAYTNLMRRR